MLVLSRKRGEALLIGDEVTVTVLAIGGGRVRIGVSAPADVEVWRAELKGRAASSHPTTDAATHAPTTPAPPCNEGQVLCVQRSIAMRVKFIPLDCPRARGPTVITRFPVILTRSSRRDVPPAARVVSRFHCEIDQRNGLLVVRNLNSRHGTFVNEVRVQRAYLWPGDKLTIGLASFVVRYKRPSIIRSLRRIIGPGPSLSYPLGGRSEQWTCPPATDHAYRRV